MSRYPVQRDAGRVEVDFACLDLNRSRVHLMLETAWSQHRSPSLSVCSAESTANRWERRFQILVEGQYDRYGGVGRRSRVGEGSSQFPGSEGRLGSTRP